MKTTKQLLLLLIILFISCHAFSQQEYVEQWKMKPHRIWVKQLDSKQQLVGWLYATTDSSVIITKDKKWDKSKFEALIQHKKSILSEQELIEIPFQNIKRLKLRKKNKVKNAALIGLGIGATIGTIGGLSRPNNSEKVEYALFFTAVYGTILSGLATLIGLDTYNVSINGQEFRYRNYRYNIACRTLKGW